MHHRVTGQRGVIRLDIELEILVQAVAAQEGNAIGGVEIILMNGRLLRFRFDEKLSAEADLFLVLDRDVEELRQVIEFALEVGVVEIRITFAAAPEDVILAAKFLGYFQTLLDL